MMNEILIGLGGLILSVLTYFAGVWRTERRHSRKDREDRIHRIFDRYMDFRRSNHTAGLDGVQKAGIATLTSTDEIEELFSLIVAHGEKHPLGPDHQAVFKGVDLVQFFRFAAEKHVNFFRTKIEDVIRDSGAKA